MELQGQYVARLILFDFATIYVLNYIVMEYRIYWNMTVFLAQIYFSELYRLHLPEFLDMCILKFVQSVFI